MKTANHKGKKVIIIRYSTQNCRVCPADQHEKLSKSDTPWSESCPLVPTSELSGITDVKKTKKKAVALKKAA